MDDTKDCCQGTQDTCSQDKQADCDQDKDNCTKGDDCCQKKE